MALAMRRFLLAVALLFAVSIAAYAWLLAWGTAPSWLRNPIAGFLEPGATVWWFALGGQFQAAPRTLGGILCASIANTAVWLAVVALARLMARFFGGRIVRR
jgi:hypothetical protein